MYRVATAVQTVEVEMAGFDARHTMSRTAIMEASARDEPFARALLRFNPTRTLPEHHADVASIEDALEKARAHFQAGRLWDGMVHLIPFLEREEVASVALTALAEGCLGAGHRVEALAIALRCLDGDPMNPRALCVAGECELDLGNKKAAQMHLAKCARIARKAPEHIEDMRTAQRLLLRMHFG